MRDLHPSGIGFSNFIAKHQGGRGQHNGKANGTAVVKFFIAKAFGLVTDTEPHRQKKRKTFVYIDKLDVSLITIII